MSLYCLIGLLYNISQNMITVCSKYWQTLLYVYAQKRITKQETEAKHHFYMHCTSNKGHGHAYVDSAGVR